MSPNKNKNTTKTQNNNKSKTQVHKLFSPCLMFHF